MVVVMKFLYNFIIQSLHKFYLFTFDGKMQQYIIINRDLQSDKMQALRSVLMSYIVKIIAPESPAYGNTIPFIKQQSLQKIISTLQLGDIIFTKTNNTWYQACRKLLHTNYDHVSIVINKNQVLHISPPIISKLDINRIMVPSRQPIIYRFGMTDKQREVMMNILVNYLGEKYNQAAIPTMIKNQVISRIFNAEKDHQFTFQSLKYSKICTQAILYAICKAKQQLQTKIVEFVQHKSGYKKIGFIMPDQFKAFLEQNKAVIIHRSGETTQKTVLTKFQESIQTIVEKFNFFTEIINKTGITTLSTVSIIKKLAMFSSNLNYKHPIFRLISFILFLQEIRNGKKINKILLLYSVLSTLLILRVYPEQIRQISNKISKL